MTLPSGRFAVLEGVDGSGKSTVARLLAQTAGLVTLETPGEPLARVKGLVLEQCSVLSRFLFFLAANVHASEQVSRLVSQQNVLLVRYCWSTIAYHVALAPASAEEIRRIVNACAGWCRIPETVIFLEVARNEQLRRLRERSKDDELQQRLAQSDQFQQALREAYAFSRNCLPVCWHTIDTTHATPGDIADQVRSILSGNIALP